MIADADAAWRTEFAVDDATFRDQCAATVAGRLLCRLRWSLGVREADRAFAPGLSERTALLWQLTWSEAECAARWPALAERFATLACGLSERWHLVPLAAPTCWPAFTRG